MSVLSATRKTATLAPPLPISNAVLQRHGLTFRQGQFSILAAAPGVGKTLFAANMAIRTASVPALYFSADSDEWTVRQRASSILSGTLLEQVETQLHQEAWEAYYADLLRNVDHVDWCFSTDIEMEFVADRVNAYVEMRGEFPRLIVVDNLGNTVVDQDNEASELKQACRELQRFARYTKAHVMGLHHVTGPKENGDQPINLGDLLYKIGKIPETVIGLNRAGENILNVTVPKQRGGRAGLEFQLPISYPTATIGGYTVTAGKAA